MDKELNQALKDFKKQFPYITSADMQTFILGWKARDKYIDKVKKNDKHEWSRDHSIF